MKNKILWTILSLFIILLITGCSGKPSEVRNEMWTEGKIIFEFIDKKMVAKQILSDQEKTQLLSFCEKYSEKNTYNTLTNKEKDVLQAITLMGQCVSMYYISIEQKDLDTQGKVLDNYLDVRKHIIKDLGIK